MKNQTSFCHIRQYIFKHQQLKKTHLKNQLSPDRSVLPFFKINVYINYDVDLTAHRECLTI